MDATEVTDRGQLDRGQDDHGHDQELTVEEAAAALGVSVKTVRRRVKAGQLRHRAVRGRNGLEHRILLDRGHGPGQDDPGHVDRGRVLGQVVHGQNGHGHDLSRPATVAGGAGQVDLGGLVTLVDKLTQQNLELAGRVGFYQARVQQLEETVRALSAPAAPNEAPAAQEPMVAVETMPTPRPWWRFW